MRTIYHMYKFVMTSERNLPNSWYCFSPCSKKCVNMFTIKFPQLTTVYIHAIRIKPGGKSVTITIKKNQQANYLSAVQIFYSTVYHNMFITGT